MDGDEGSGRGLHKLIWMGLCCVLGAGLALWSMYLVGLLFLLLVSVAFGSRPGARRRSQTALVLGFEGGMGSLAFLYRFEWGQSGPGFYLYLGAVACVGAAVVLFVIWWGGHGGKPAQNKQEPGFP